jgi:hypothetical protein
MKPDSTRNNDYVKFLEGLTNEELEQFERELKDGNVHKYIEKKKEFFKIKDKTCPVCGNVVEEDCFVLIFGDPSIRKKAHFCGIDCLDYFLHKNLKYKEKLKKPIEDIN